MIDEKMMESLVEARKLITTTSTIDPETRKEIAQQLYDQLTPQEAEELLKPKVITAEDKQKMLDEFLSRVDIQMRIATWDAHHRRPNRPYPPPPIIFSDTKNEWVWVSRDERRKLRGNS